MRTSQSRFTALAGIAALSIALAGCAASPDLDTTPDGNVAETGARALLPESYLESGVLTVATESGYPPYVFSGATADDLQGLGVDIVEAVGQELGLEIQWEMTTYPNFIPGVSSGRYDVAVSGVYDTPERQEQVDFVDFVMDGAIVLVNAGNPKNLTAETLCGMRVTAQAGSASATRELPERSETCVNEGKPEIEIMLFPGAPEAALALTSERADAYTTGAASGYFQLSQSDGAMEAAGPAYNQVPVGMLVEKGSDLTSAIQYALQVVIDSGQYDDILAKWNLTESAVECAAVNTDFDACVTVE